MNIGATHVIDTTSTRSTISSCGDENFQHHANNIAIYKNKS